MMDEFVSDILKKQCDLVGADYDSIDFNDDLWFFKHQWTKEQESEFIDWMTKYLQSNKKARSSIMKIPSRSKSICKRTAQQFAFNFGWKYKKE